MDFEVKPASKMSRAGSEWPMAFSQIVSTFACAERLDLWQL